MQTSYTITQYIDGNSGNLCELFQVKVDQNVVFERDYGSTGGGIREYVDDFHENSSVLLLHTTTKNSIFKY